MPIKIRTDLEFGDVWYIKNDPEQLERLLVGVVFLPGGQLKFELSYMGEVVTVWDFECSKSIDKTKLLELNTDDEQ